MLKRKSVIPIATIIAISSSINIFADGESSNNISEYKEIKYKTGIVTPNKGVNVRKTPEIKDNNKLLAEVKGEKLEILGEENGWYKVETQKYKFGWVKSDYIELGSKDVYVNVDKLNFREDKSLSSKVNEVLTKGTKLEVIEDNGDWIKVKLGNKEGYVYNSYITEEKFFIKPVIKNKKLANSNHNNYNKEEVTNSNQSKPNKDEVANNSNLQQKIVNLAYAQLGKPYVWGAEGPSSFDCSGLMTYIYKNGAGVNLPRTSKQQSKFGKTVSRSNLQPGDLIFSSTDGSGSVSHVGIYVGNGEMIHSPKPGDVVQRSSINNSYWNNSYLWSKRVI